MLVSIMMPTWNYGRYISEAIESIKRQTYEDWELIIFDDGSSDGTDRIVEQYLSDSRIHFFRDPKHHNCPYARNRCLDHCNGDLIARQDADDLCHPDRLKICVDHFQRYPNVDLVSTKYQWLLEDGSLKRISSIGAIDIPEYLETGRRGPCCPSIVARYNVYHEIDFNEDISAGSDGKWNIDVIKSNFEWGFINKYLYIQRRHPNQISQRLKKEQQKVHLK